MLTKVNTVISNDLDKEKLPGDQFGNLDKKAQLLNAHKQVAVTYKFPEFVRSIKSATDFKALPVRNEN